jgi:hypothetical protein
MEFDILPEIGVRPGSDPELIRPPARRNVLSEESYTVPEASMIRLAIRRVKPDEERNLRKWMAELKQRHDEVRQTFAQEGVRHEQAYLLRTTDGPILIYAMEAADHDRASAAFRNSTLPIDEQHKRVMQQVLAENIDAELLYECSLVQ